MGHEVYIIYVGALAGGGGSVYLEGVPAYNAK